MGRRLGVLVGAFIILGALVAPAVAGPEQRAVERVEVPWFLGFPDVEQGLVVLINITREGWCSDAQIADELAFLAWLEGGEVGPPPEPTAEEPEGVELVPLSFVETGQGAIVFSLHARDVPMEVWTLDEGAALVGPCTDTDDSEGPYATGTAQFRVNDNDLEASGTRGNAFGDHGHATLTTADGTTVRAHWRFHVNDRCYAPDDGPPACLIEFVELR